MTRPRVVIESRRPDAAVALASALVAWHIDPIICTGPDDAGHGCPILEHEECPLIARSDAVVYDLDLHDPTQREVLVDLVANRKGLPIITERSSHEAREHGDLLKHCVVVVPYSAQHTADAVVAALAAVRQPAQV